MKKAKPSKRNSPSRAGAAPKTVDQYLAAVPEPARSTLNRIRATIRSAVPPETVEGISYGMPVFKYQGSLMWFAAFSDHCSLFPTAAVIEACKKDLNNFSTSKGTIHFPVNKPLPDALLKKMIKIRLAQVQNKKR
jgi:uncharacterized protein YdhG (YjbR/CyaY superfamily)